MIIKTSIKIVKAAFGIAVCVSSPRLAASSISYHVDVDISALAGNPNAPFALDFQLTDGDGLNNSSALIQNFNFSGGNAVGSPILFNGASGSLSSSVSLVDTAFFSDLFQGFSSGATLSFDVSLVSNAAGLTPDGFAFGIGSANDGGLSFFDILTEVDLTSDVQTVQVFSVDGISTSVQVPEAGSKITLPIGLAALGFFGFLTGTRRKVAAA